MHVHADVSVNGVRMVIEGNLSIFFFVRGCIQLFIYVYFCFFVVLYIHIYV